MELPSHFNREDNLTVWLTPWRKSVLQTNLQRNADQADSLFGKTV